MDWADAARDIGVRANADTPADAELAQRFEAEGIGLCRTEHMFFEEDRLTVMREMIFAETPRTGRAALERLLPMQRAISSSCSDHAGPAGLHPPVRPAAARVPAHRPRRACANWPRRWTCRCRT
jgi:hypothetical protein